MRFGKIITTIFPNVIPGFLPNRITVLCGTFLAGIAISTVGKIVRELGKDKTALKMKELELAQRSSRRPRRDEDDED